MLYRKGGEVLLMRRLGSEKLIVVTEIIFGINKNIFTFAARYGGDALRKAIAQMAELVDALDSKSCFRKGVQVRFLFWARKACKD